MILGMFCGALILFIGIIFGMSIERVRRGDYDQE